MSKIATRPEEGRLYGLSDEGSVHLTLERQAFVLFHETRSGRALGVALAANDQTLGQLTAAILSATAHFGRENPLGAKIVGDSEVLKVISERLRAEAIAILSSTERSSRFELLFTPAIGRLQLAREAAASVPVSASSSPRRVKVLIVDDSPTLQKLLRQILSADPGIEVVGVSGLPSEVEGLVERLNPDVITLDIHMPEMNGVKLLRHLLTKRPISAVMISSLAMEEGSLVLDALESGAVDYVQKPTFENVAQVGEVICEKVKGAAASRVIQPSRATVTRSRLVPSISGNLDLDSLLLIGASTGGTEAIRAVLTALPEQIPPVLIVQHIPPVFSKAFADRMNQLCPFEVREAVDGAVVEPGHVWIAPGGTQMTVEQRGGQLCIKIDPSAEPMNRHKPSVDALFLSAAKLKRRKRAAAILTGMGADGARGLLALKESGAQTLAQDEASCVVYGMPREAARLGAAQKIVALSDVASQLTTWVTRSPAKSA